MFRNFVKLLALSSTIPLHVSALEKTKNNNEALQTFNNDAAPYSTKHIFQGLERLPDTEIFSVTTDSFITDMTSQFGVSETSEFPSNIITKEKTYTSVADMMQKQKRIRMYIDDGPNFGNQAANYYLILRMRELGFTGKIECIYDKKIADKIKILFDLPDPLSEEHEDKIKNITFLTTDAYREKLGNNKVDPTEILITGARDSNLRMMVCHQSDPENPIDIIDICKKQGNEANAGRSEIFIKLDNYLDTNRAFQIWQACEEKACKNDRYIDHSKSFILAPRENLTSAVDYLKTPVGEKLLIKKPGLPKLIEAVEQKSVYFMPIYGAPFKTYNDEQKERTAFPVILQTLAGARVAQSKMGNEKPFIVAGFFDYEQQAEILSKLIKSAHWGEYETANAADARKIIQSLGLNENLIIASLEDPTLENTIANLKPNQMLFVYTGPLPMKLFNGLFANGVPIREGASTLNALIQLGIPHLRCGGNIPKENWELGHDDMDDSLKEQLQTFYERYCALDPNTHQIKAWNDNTHELLGELLIQGFDETSSFSKYFEEIQRKTEDPENDRIYQAFDKAREILNQKKSIANDPEPTSTYQRPRFR